MVTRFCMILLIIGGIGWYVQNTVDFGQVKENAINVFKKEKTINAVNSKRAADQADIYDVTNR